jgi:hypothetical protein
MMEPLMGPAAPDVVAIAEMLNLHLPPPPDEERVLGPRFCAFIGKRDIPGCNVVQRLRLDPAEIEAVVAEVRALFRSRDKSALTWEISASTRPADLYERLTALGMVPDEEPVVAGMILRRPLPPGGEGFTVRRVETVDDFRTHALVYHRCFGRGGPPPTDEQLEADYHRRRGREPYLVRYLAWDGDTAVAAADAVMLPGAVALAGGATLPEARGHGAYRALLRAREQEAFARGTPVLVVQAGRMSRPILERLGFEEVARVRVLLDRLR